MSNPVPRRVLVCAAIILLWPPCHIVLSLGLGFSPWILGGWGMYAEPHPATVIVNFGVWDGDRLQTVDLEAYHALPEEQREEIENRAKRLRYLRQPAQAGALARAAVQAGVLPRDARYAVGVGVPKVDLSRGLVTYRTRWFLVEEEQVSRIEIEPRTSTGIVIY